MTQSVYNKSNPFLASIKERYPLSASQVASHQDSRDNKHTMHFVLDLEGSNITYRAGDSIAILPANDEFLVKQTINASRTCGDSLVKDKQGICYSFEDFLKNHCNLADVSRKFLSEISLRQTNPDKKQALELLLKEEQKQQCKEYLRTHAVLDVLQENPEAAMTAQEISSLLMPLLPRFYSIASSMSAVGNEVHLTIAEVIYEANGRLRHGTCTHYLCNLVPLNTRSVPVYIQPAHAFSLPDDQETAIIMVGPGTGVAPFRAFMQEREAKNSKGKNWLFFGEKHHHRHFYYKDYWETLVQRGKMRLETAFSRDQAEKMYVQHRLIEHGAEVFQWLEEGAHFYVCGDAEKMAKDVDAALHHIVSRYGQRNEQQTKEYLRQLKQQKRYLRDVY